MKLIEGSQPIANIYQHDRDLCTDYYLRLSNPKTGQYTWYVLDSTGYKEVLYVGKVTELEEASGQL